MRGEGGYSLVELVVVMAILGVVVGGIVTVFTAGINADADQTRRYQAQEDGRLALNKIRRDVHSSCTDSTPATYNTWQSSVTLYMSADACAAGANSITWCATGSGNTYALMRVVGTTCTGGVKMADFLTTNMAFAYLPPNAHVTTVGTGAAGISTIDGSYSLPRLHVDFHINRNPAKPRDEFHAVDDVVFRNGPRACGAGVASC